MTKKPDCKSCDGEGYIVTQRLHARNRVKKGQWVYLDIMLGLELCPECAVEIAIDKLHEQDGKP